MNTPPHVSAARVSTLYLVFTLVTALPAFADPQEPWRIVDRQTIEAYNLRSVADAVEMVAGFGTVRTYVKRQIPTARGVFQTHYANRVLLMINGVPTWHASTGEGYLERVSIDQVERVEVMLGPGSVLHGTQAYAGVVNIILRTAPAPDRPVLIASMHAGAPRAFEAAAGMAWQGKQFSGSISGSLLDSDGLNDPFKDEAGITGLVQTYTRSSTVAAQLSYTAGALTHRMLLNAFRADETFLGATPTFALGLGKDHEIRGVLASYGLTYRVGKRVDLEASVAYDDNRRESARSADNLLRTDIRGDRFSAGASAIARFNRRSWLRAGVDFDQRHSERYTSYLSRTDAVVDNNQMRDRKVEEHSAFAHYGFDGDRVSAGIGARLTSNENFGYQSAVDGTIGYRFTRSHAVTFRAGQSYRSPTLFELYFEPAERTVFGNVDLAPETSNEFEAEYAGTFGDLTVRATGYHATYDNQILRSRRFPGSLTDTSTIYGNGTEFEADGLEVETRYRMGGARTTEVFLDYGLISADDSAGQFKYVPAHTITAGASRAFGRWLASGLVAHQSSTAGPKTPISGQSRLNLNLGYRHRVNSLNLHHTLSLTDATDSDWAYPEYVRQNINSIPLGFGRTVTYGLRLSF